MEKDYDEIRKQTAKEVVSKLTSMVNDMGFDPENFCKAMSWEHRTLQQNFTRLVFQWIEFIASDDYVTDLRNQDSKTIAKKVLEGFTMYNQELQKKNLGDFRNYSPSKWLSHI